MSSFPGIMPRKSASWSSWNDKCQEAFEKLKQICMNSPYGSTFDVFTDNNPLTYILSTAKLDAMGHRWVARLEPYNFSLFYKPGKINPADALSRIPWNEVGTTEVKAVLDLSEIDRTGINLPGLDSEGCILSQKSARISENRSRWIECQKQDDEIIYDLISNEQLDDYHMKSTDSESIRSYLKVQSVTCWYFMG